MSILSYRDNSYAKIYGHLAIEGHPSAFYIVPNTYILLILNTRIRFYKKFLTLVCNGSFVTHFPCHPHMLMQQVGAAHSHHALMFLVNKMRSINAASCGLSTSIFFCSGWLLLRTFSLKVCLKQRGRHSVSFGTNDGSVFAKIALFGATTASCCASHQQCHCPPPSPKLAHGS